MAWSKLSKTTMALPSAGTNPSLPASKGLLAFCGSSFELVRALNIQNPDKPISLILASTPPASTTSAAPLLMTSNASPMAWLEAAHAVITVEL